MTMPRQKKYPDGYVTTGVVFEPEVMAFIKRLAREEERNQSTVINRIIRDFARRQGEPLTAAAPSLSAAQTESDSR